MNGKCGASAIAQKQDLKRLSEIISKESQNLICGEIASELVYLDLNTKTFIWRCEDEKRELFYGDYLNIGNGERPIPKLLFKYQNDTLYVYAYKEWKGLNDTILYHAPFHNIYNDGKICMGNARIKILRNDDFKTFITRLTFLFFRNPGTELHHTLYGNLNNFHIDLKNMNAFPESVLIQIEDKTKSILKL